MLVSIYYNISVQRFDLMKSLPALKTGASATLISNIQALATDSFFGDHWPPLTVFVTGLIFLNLEYEGIFLNWIFHIGATIIGYLVATQLNLAAVLSPIAGNYFEWLNGPEANWNIGLFVVFFILVFYVLNMDCLSRAISFRGDVLNWGPLMKKLPRVKKKKTKGEKKKKSKDKGKKSGANKKKKNKK